MLKFFLFEHFTCPSHPVSCGILLCKYIITSNGNELWYSMVYDRNTLIYNALYEILKETKIYIDRTGILLTL